MKVFVWTKTKPTRKIATIEDAVAIRMDEINGETLYILTDNGTTFKFNTKNVKTTIYQN